MKIFSKKCEKGLDGILQMIEFSAILDINVI